jgi:hypothetical protein
VVINATHFTPISGSASGWSADVSSDRIAFSGGSISPGQSGSFSVTLESGGATATDEVNVSSSTEASGADPGSCDGTTQLTITDSTETSISSLSVSSVTDTTAKVTFTTNTSATSTIQYGTTSSYGTTKTVSSSGTTSHSYTITGLTKNTTYHYQVSATDGSTSASSGDQTFTTSVPGASPTPTVAPTNAAGPTNTPIPTATPTPDIKPPTVTLNSVSPGPYKTPPTISGSAVDNASVSQVQFTTDNGGTWQNIKAFTGKGTTTASFSFTPTMNQNGEVKITVRAVDDAGNKSAEAIVPLTLDTQGPQISIQTDFSHPYPTLSEIDATATDPSGVSSLEYSIGGGGNWQAATGDSHHIPLPSLDDGNYDIVFRATDILGNVSQELHKTLIIDRLPPRLGAAMLLVPPHVLPPLSGGNWTTTANVTHSFFVSLVGGPVSATADVTRDNTPVFSLPLAHRSQTSLWTTDITFPSPGTYTITISAVDGAGNHLQKKAGSVTVLPQGRIVSSSGQGIAGEVTLYVKDDASGNFVVWDGQSFGQANPVRTSDNGMFSFFPPAGTYYLSIHPFGGYQNSTTNTFVLSSPTPMTATIPLKSQPKISLGFFSFTFPQLFVAHTTIAPPQATNTTANQVSLNASFPDVKLTDLTRDEDSEVSLATLRGHASLLVILNTFSPQTPSQLSILSSYATTHPTMPIVVIFPHESPSTVSMFKARGGYPFLMVADPQGDVIESLPYRISPSIYTINEKATATTVVEGIQEATQLVQ